MNRLLKAQHAKGSRKAGSRKMSEADNSTGGYLAGMVGSGTLPSAKAKSKLGGHGKENPRNTHVSRRKTESTPYSGATKQAQVGKGPRKNKSTTRKDAGLGGHRGN